VSGLAGVEGKENQGGSSYWPNYVLGKMAVIIKPPAFQKKKSTEHPRGEKVVKKNMGVHA